LKESNVLGTIHIWLPAPGSYLSLRDHAAIKGYGRTSVSGDINAPPLLRKKLSRSCNRRNLALKSLCHIISLFKLCLAK